MSQSNINSFVSLGGSANKQSAISSASASVSQTTTTSTSSGSVAVSPEFRAAIQAAATQAVLAAVRASSIANSETAFSPVFSLANRHGLFSSPDVTSCVASSSSSQNTPVCVSSAGVTSGQPIITVPSFLSTFTPAMATSDANLASSMSATMPVASFGGVPVYPIPTLNKPFVVGPGFSPVPYKLVSAITSGKYIDLEDLLSSNLAAQEEEPQLLLDGRVVFTAGKKKPKRQIDDIVSWMEAFTIYSLILTSSFSHRWRDLSAYKLLILRTYQQFGGKAWRSYDKAFREHAAAIHLTDWSQINSQLFSFHKAGSSARVCVNAEVATSIEATGSPSSDIICHSWNRGSCTAPTSTCRYAHRCSVCRGGHRSRDCNAPQARKRKADSPLPGGREAKS